METEEPTDAQLIEMECNSMMTDRLPTPKELKLVGIYLGVDGLKTQFYIHWLRNARMIWANRARRTPIGDQGDFIWARFKRFLAIRMASLAKLAKS